MVTITRKRRLRTTWKRFRWWQKLLVTIAMIVALWATFAGIESTSRAFMPCENTTTIIASTTGANNLVAGYPGMTAQFKEQFSPVLDVLLQYGDVLEVDYGGPKANLFCEDEVARDTAAAIEQAEANRHYEHVIMLGLSIGGMLSVDTVMYLGVDGVPVDLVPVCAPTTSGDLIWPLNLAGALKVLPFGWIGNQFNIDGTPYQTSFWRDQASYIAWHGGPAPDSLADDRRVNSLTYVNCMLDTQYVKQSAGDTWVAAFPGATVINVLSGHVDFRGNTELWRQTFESLLTTLTE